MTNSKWVGGPNFIVCSRFGSKKSNSKLSKGRQRYSCGTDRAYLGDIMAALQASYRAKRGS